MALFKYSLNASTIRTTPVLEQIRVAATAGYEAIELWHDHLDEHLAAGGTLADVRSALNDNGLTLPTTVYLAGWFQTSGPERETAMEEVRRRLDQAATLGAEFVVAGPPLEIADRTRGAQNYAELLDLGRSFGVRPAFEYLGFAADINRIEDAVDIMIRSQHTDACIIIDPFHGWRGGGSVDALNRVDADRIAISHFNDAPADPPPQTQGDEDRVMPGEGAIDLSAWCETLTTIGYNRWLSLELFRPDLWARNPLDVAIEGLEKMRAVAEAG